MKHLVALLVLSVMSFVVVMAQTKQQVAVKAADGALDTAVVNVPTVVCSSCVATITKALKKVNGVKTTSIDLKKKIATVTYASSKTSLTKIETAIAKAGYDANSVKRDPAAYEKLDACCKADSKE